MRVFLVHVRDPQFYAIPRQKRGPNGRLQVMGFPPIGIMSLSSVLKRAGHEVTMFDQANPETPDDVIIDEMRRQKPDLVGMSFLSTTSYPYAKMLARQLRAADSGVKLAFGGVFATLNAQLVKAQCKEVDFVCRGDGEQLIVDLLERLNDPDTVTGVTWQEKDGTLRNNPNRALPRDLDQWPFPDRESLPLDFVESMPLDVPAVLSLDRFTTMQTSRGCPWPCVFCDIPIFNEGKWRARTPAHVVAEFEQLRKDGYGSVYFVDDHFLLQPKRIEAICDGLIAAEESHQIRARRASGLSRPASVPEAREVGVPNGDVRHREREPEDSRPPEEGADARGNRIGCFERQSRRHRDRAWLLRRRYPRRDRRRPAGDVPLRVEDPGGQLRLQPPVRLQRHAALAGVREARAA